MTQKTDFEDLKGINGHSPMYPLSFVGKKQITISHFTLTKFLLTNFHQFAIKTE